MTDDAPSPDAPPPARSRGAPRHGAVPRMETVRVTAPDLRRRAALERTRVRLLFAAGFFALLFLAVIGKLADATILQPLKPPPPPVAQGPGKSDDGLPGLRQVRATITDRNGQILAISLPTASVYANPREMMDPADAARKLKQVLPSLDENLIAQRLASDKQFVYIDRQVTPREQLAINALGIPGVYFEPTEERRYPQGHIAAQVLGGVDVDGHGIAGVEKWFNKRLRTDPEPLRLSIDARVEGIVRDELAQGMDEFQAIGGYGIVMNVNTGEVLAMVSLPDYDANDFGSATPDERFNRAATGAYEPGSVFKLQTAAMALDDGLIHYWDRFNTTHPIPIGRFHITDYEPKNRWLYLPEVIAYSSNIGASRIGLIVGGDRQREWLQKLGLMTRSPIQLPEAALPILHPEKSWGEATIMTVSFGNGIAETPIQVITATAAIVDGGILRKPTLLAEDGNAPTPGERVMSPTTSDIMRRMMRDVIMEGTAKSAKVPGYFVIGKTGTSQKVGAHGYRQHTNLSSFIGAFPGNAPHYIVYMMLDSPKGNKATYGFSTGGAVMGPIVGRVMARIGPMLGVLPETDSTGAIEASLAMPLQPGAPPGAVVLGPGHPFPPGASEWALKRETASEHRRGIVKPVQTRSVHEQKPRRSAPSQVAAR